MRRWQTFAGSLLVLLAASTRDVRAEAAFELQLVKEAPRSVFTKATKTPPKIRPNAIVADNVRAVAVLYAIARYEKAGLFAARDRIVADVASKKLTGAAAGAAKKLVSTHGAATIDRSGALGFVADLIHEQFQAIVTDSVNQMDAYAELVSSVTASVDQFMSENTSENSGRDSLETLMVGLSNAGYGATHWAAAELSQQAHEITHVVQQKSVQEAYGAKDATDLIAKLSGRKRAAVERELALAAAGAKLLLWLRHAAAPGSLKVRAKKDDVAALVARLRKLGAYRALTPKPGAKAPEPRPLCLPPGAKKPAPCALLAVQK